MKMSAIAVKERPILFSAPMVRAILDGRKTQTRRIMKPQPEEFKFHDGTTQWRWRTRDGDLIACASGDNPNFYSPYGMPGERLWVRETFWAKHDSEWDEMSGTTIDWGAKIGGDDENHNAGIDYCATPSCMNPPKCANEETVCPHTDTPVPGEWWLSPPNNWNGEDDYHGCGEWVFLPWDKPWSKKASIYMPRWASRITLEITDVRVQRVQDISPADCIAEGISKRPRSCPFPWHVYAKEDFQSLWRDIHGKDSWAANPWVWAIAFKRIEAQE